MVTVDYRGQKYLERSGNRFRNGQFKDLNSGSSKEHLGMEVHLMRKERNLERSPKRRE